MRVVLVAVKEHVEDSKDTFRVVYQKTKGWIRKKFVCATTAQNM